MIRGKRLISLLLALMLCLGLAIQANAADLSDTKKKAQELEEKKKAAEGEKASLEAQLSSIVSEMEDTKTKIDKKEAEITEKEDELIQAKVDENDQYESMKKRIKYMYENGNSQFIEILCESKSIGDFLNNAEYITTISEYDRNMLVEFQEVVKKVEDQEAALKEEYAELETMQNDLIAKQDEVSGLMASKEDEISKLDSGRETPRINCPSWRRQRQLRSVSRKKRPEAEAVQLVRLWLLAMELLPILVRDILIYPVRLGTGNSLWQAQARTIKALITRRESEPRSMQRRQGRLSQQDTAGTQER